MAGESGEDEDPELESMLTYSASEALRAKDFAAVHPGGDGAGAAS